MYATNMPYRCVILPVGLRGPSACRAGQVGGPAPWQNHERVAAGGGAAGVSAGLMGAGRARTWGMTEGGRGRIRGLKVPRAPRAV